MRPLCVAVGPNGVGKTTLLEVLNLVKASASGDLGSALQAGGGLTSLSTKGSDNIIGIGICIQIDGLPNMYYRLTLSPQGPWFTVMDELAERPANDRFVPYGDPLDDSDPFEQIYVQKDRAGVLFAESKGKPLTVPDWPLKPNETSLSQAPPSHRVAEIVRTALQSCTLYVPIEVDPQSPVRLPQTLQPIDLPGQNGESLIACLLNRRETDPEGFELWMDTLRAAFPRLQAINFPIVAAGRLLMTWKEKDFPQAFDISQLSEGTVRFLWLSALLLSRDLPDITLLDEPETSLHPELLSFLADMMREASKRTHLIVATHSDRLIRFLKPDEVLICDLNDDGGTKFTWADELNLDHWLEEYSLDQLWSMNLLGGTPRS